MQRFIARFKLYYETIPNGFGGSKMDVLSKLGLGMTNSGGFGGFSWQSSGGEILTSKNPATEKEIAVIEMASRNDYEEITKIAHQGFLKWREVPAPVRGECIRLIAQELRAHKDLLGTLVSIESGKIKPEGDGEVQEMIDMADFAVGLSRMLYGKIIPSERKHHRMLEQWHPLGPVGVITAFNFPMAVWAWNAFIAAICGDTVIWKPSHKVPLCAIAVQLLCNKVMKSLGHDGVFSLVVTHDTATAEALVADERLPLISFTGSTRVGRNIAGMVSQRLGRYLLELSGNNAVIIDETADLDLAIPAVVFGAVGTAGQRCTSTRRLIVHRSRYDQLVTQLVAAYKQIPIGNPLDPHILMGPLIDDLAVQAYQRAIEEIKGTSGEILFGGSVLDGPGHFVEPTLVYAQEQSELIRRETFAPILYILTFDSIEEAISLQNDVKQGLSSALFTQNLRHEELFLSVLGSDCGLANVNMGTSGAEIGGAFGGEKETGGGREAGSDVWKYYMRRQTCTINWSNELPLAQGINFTLPKKEGAM